MYCFRKFSSARYWIQLFFFSKSLIIILQQKRGQLLISLMYVPLEGRLVLGVIKASNLRAMDINGSSGEYLNFSQKVETINIVNSRFVEFITESFIRNSFAY